MGAFGSHHAGIHRIEIHVEAKVFLLVEIWDLFVEDLGETTADRLCKNFWAWTFGILIWGTFSAMYLLW
jgi:hypothetical protein